MTTDGTARVLMAQLGEALRDKQRLAADALIGKLLAARAPLGAQWRMLAQVTRHNGALSHARRAMRLHVEQAGNAPAARFEEAALLADIGDVDGAGSALQALPSAFPDRATHAHFLGTLALNRGDLPLAREQFGKVLAIRPTSGATWLALTDASRSLPVDDWAPRVVDAAPMLSGAAPADQAAFQYALGTAHDALGSPSAAFAAFDYGAALIRPTRPYDAAADRAAAMQAMQPGQINVTPTIDTARPIFVFGTPRSGTTLVEQILASHSGVADGGEIRLFDIVAQRIGGLTSEALARAARVTGIDALAQDYLTLLGERFGSHGRIVDKTLTTQRYLALVTKVLPEAPLVWVRRNPLDTAWSCFRTFFAQGIAWSFDQQAIAEHMLLDEQLLAFWHEELGERLLVVDYEALVADKQATIGRLLAHCGLAAEPGVFEPHRTARSVITASVSQVRSPINAGAVGAAAPYRAHLASFAEAYAAKGGRLD